jgi:hypothetical protein
MFICTAADDVYKTAGRKGVAVSVDAEACKQKRINVFRVEWLYWMKK